MVENNNNIDNSAFKCKCARFFLDTLLIESATKTCIKSTAKSIKLHIKVGVASKIVDPAPSPAGKND